MQQGHTPGLALSVMLSVLFATAHYFVVPSSLFVELMVVFLLILSECPQYSFRAVLSFGLYTLREFPFTVWQNLPYIVFFLRFLHHAITFKSSGFGVLGLLMCGFVALAIDPGVLFCRLRMGLRTVSFWDYTVSYRLRGRMFFAFNPLEIVAAFAVLHTPLVALLPIQVLLMYFALRSIDSFPRKGSGLFFLLALFCSPHSWEVAAVLGSILFTLYALYWCILFRQYFWSLGERSFALSIYLPTVLFSSVPWFVCIFSIVQALWTLHPVVPAKMMLQSADSDDLGLPPDFLSKLIRLETAMYKYFTGSRQTVSIIISSIILVYQLSRSRSKLDSAAAIGAFCNSSWSNKELIQSMIYTRYSDDFQESVELQSLEDYITSSGEGLKRFRSLRKSGGVAKIRKFTMYVLTLGLFESAGITLESSGYSEIEAAGLRKKYRLDVDFMESVLEMALFVVTAGHQIANGYGIEQVLHSSESYTQLYDDFFLFSADFDRSKNFGVTAGVDHTRLLSRCVKLKDRFQAVLPLVAQLTTAESRLMRGYWVKLLAIEAELKNSNVCQSTRPSPFSMLLYGDSSVGKSALLDILFTHFGNLRKLNIAPQHKYNVSPVSEFWDGYDSHMWAVVMDDIAFRHPALGVPDSSVDLILNVVNNVPMMTPQASLEKKGTTPLLASLVLGTTNTLDLNAKSYYANPAAVLRRFPYVLEVLVKEQFATSSGALDPAKIPRDMGYTDVWNLKVHRVIPRGVKQVDREPCGEFSAMKDFLKWYTERVFEFYSHQEQSMDATQRIFDEPLCEECHLPTTFCDCVTTVQGGDFPSPSPSWFSFYQRFRFHVWALCSYVQSLTIPTFDIPLVDEKYVWYTFIWIRYRAHVMISIASAGVARFLASDKREFFRHIGDRVQSRVLKVPRSFILLAAALCVLLAVRSLYVRSKGTEIQGNFSGSRPTPLTKERENIYYNDGVSSTDFSGSELGHSLPIGAFLQKISNNVVIGVFEKKCGRFSYGRFIGIGGCYYLGNNHTVPTDFSEVTFSTGSRKAGVEETITCKLDQKDIVRDETKDICLIHVPSLKLRKNILKYFGDVPSQGSSDAHYVNRSLHGDVQPVHVGKVSFRKMDVLDIAKDRPVAVSAVPVRTEVGDCGMPLIVDNGTRKSIIGLHVAAISATFSVVQTYSVANLVSLSDIEALVAQTPFNGGDIVSDNAPVLNSAEIERPLSSLHFKSVFRYLSEGTVTVHGSFTGFRRKAKSRVESTKFRSHLEELGIISEYGKPVMLGYKPWRIAALDLVTPVTSLCASRVRACGESFFQDILASVGIDAISKILHTYDTFTAVNGAAGVAYVDGINRSTSAGAPWSRVKKHYLRPIAPVGELQDPVELTEEILSRVEDIQDKYARGEAYRPVFTAHLKDEPVSLKKQESGKTRVFCGAPFDWSIVVRKLFLSHIRLMQNFKLDFECAVGTVAQSIEWSRIYAYVTKFGESRIVAGDYGAFDKTMPPVVVLEAFAVLIRLAKVSGNFSEIEIRAMWCVAHDTAYGLTDFNGDLVTFWGSNPSGHPLTVIINSLVNSLYVRLVYSEKYPVQTFRDNVSLLTYGDDNIMSVNEECKDFDHTVLQDTFAGYGIRYTMADKESESVPFIHIDEASFLKRRWRYDPHQMVYTAPLEMDSVHKMLSVAVRSKSISWDEQHANAIQTALAEFFFHGPEKFGQGRVLLENLIVHADLVSWFSGDPLKEYDSFWENFWDLSHRVDFRL